MAPARRQQQRRLPPPGPLGVWIFGARGGLATTLITGARAIAAGLAEPIGLLTATEMFAGIELAAIGDLVFGGHEVRDGSLWASAQEIHELTGTLPWPLLQKVRHDLTRVDRDLRPGTMINAGPVIEKVTGARPPARADLRAEVERIAQDIRDFMRRHRLARCVCVNLTSTEPPLKLGPAHRSLAAFERALDQSRVAAVRPSALYAYAAASLGLPFVNFTPSNGALLPAIQELFVQNQAPFMGADGKTGETLVKSSLAPMFKYRNLKVLAWQGYNMLGDRDGIVLADERNKASKVESKDALLSKILGYPLHTKVAIDYVPSLNDLKTAWDFIHFQGFLGFKMSMQFTWQGADAILAAPLVLDMVRLADLAARRGEAGPMRHLSCFFKKPVGVDEHDLHMQWHLLTDYVAQLRRAPNRG